MTPTTLVASSQRCLLDAHPSAVEEDGRLALGGKGDILTETTRVIPSASAQSSSASRRASREDGGATTHHRRVSKEARLDEKSGGEGTSVDETARCSVFHAAIISGSPDAVVLEILARAAARRTEADRMAVKEASTAAAASEAASAIKAKTTQRAAAATAASAPGTAVLSAPGRPTKDTSSTTTGASGSGGASSQRRLQSLVGGAASALRASTNPALLELHAPSGCLALHLAIVCRRSESLVLSLLRGEDGAARVRDVERGSLPLHLALSHGASEKVCMEIFESYRDAVRQKDSEGRLPIALALEHGAPRAVSWAITMANPEALRSQSEGGVRAATAGIRLKSAEEMRMDIDEARSAGTGRGVG